MAPDNTDNIARSVIDALSGVDHRHADDAAAQEGAAQAYEAVPV